MPNDHSRSRDRHRDRERERLRLREGEQTRARGYRRYRDDDDVLEDTYDADPQCSSRHRRSRGGGYYYSERDTDVGGGEEENYVREDQPMTADAAPRPRSADVRPSAGDDGGRRGDRSTAKESSATSPAKRRDRERGRRGYRRYDYDGRTRDGSGSPTKGERARERRHRDYYGYGADLDDDEARERYRQRELRRQRRREQQHAAAAREKHTSADTANSASGLLSKDALAKLTEQYEKERAAEWAREAREEKRRRKQQRVVSGPVLEEGRSRRRGGGGGATIDPRWRKEGYEGDGEDDEARGKRRMKWICIGAIVAILLLVIVVPVAVSEVKKRKSGDSDASASTKTNGPANENLKNIDPNSIPAAAKGTYLDPFTWYDTTDFNVTYTNETVGGLPIMGLNSTWDDSARPNDNVPPLNEQFDYGKQPIRGVNLGGWLSIEPFITPSLFTRWTAKDGVVDEWTLSQKLGPSAARTIEQHYATFITEQDFADIRDAGFDHVRIQYSYWAVKTYEGDPYVPKIAWRYLLRAIEYCRKYGLRVNLDLHGIPGSQNGWNHSGHQGPIGWLNGTDGNLNRQRSLEIHDQLSQFFAQPRYKNIVTIYGLANEPKMLSLPIADVLNWTIEATELVQKNGIKAWVVFGDGFLNLSKWKAMLKNGPAKMMLDTHQYTIFNTGQLGLTPENKIKLVCNDWVGMIGQVNSATAGWGPTICGEWSQADTDCAKFLNNVNWGNRWTGTYNTGDPSTSVLTPLCPTAKTGPPCDCGPANADPSTFSDVYKKFLQTYAEAQMYAFEKAHGWFYWTWKTESAAQWSYRTGWKNGFLPKKAYEPEFKCTDEIPDFSGLVGNY